MAIYKSGNCRIRLVDTCCRPTDEELKIRARIDGKYEDLRLTLNQIIYFFDQCYDAVYLCEYRSHRKWEIAFFLSVDTDLHRFIKLLNNRGASLKAMHEAKEIIQTINFDKKEGTN